MTVREHFAKHRLAYIAAGTGIAAGLAGATLGYAIGADPVGVFGTSAKHWGTSPRASVGVQASLRPSLTEMGIQAGPNPLAFSDAGNSVYQGHRSLKERIGGNF